VEDGKRKEDMKIRTGFVSNSSSMSFIVRADEVKSVFALAQKMIKLREWDEKGTDIKLISKIQSQRRTVPFRV
jgi:hypothetical protein